MSATQADSNPGLLAFFGPTGGVTNGALVQALRSSRNCIALARTPSKLREQLLAQKLSEECLDSHLTIVQGNALDRDAVKQTLTANNRPNCLVSSIVTGLGGTPSLRWNWGNPLNCTVLDQPNICTDAAAALMDALQEIYSADPSMKESSKPDLVFVSTTGISRPRGPEDVPFWMRFLYHQVLAEPHKDKRNLEKLLRDNIDGKDETRGVLFASVVGIRPTLLTGAADADDGYGLDLVRSGREQNPALGYTVRRSDVGHWIWQELLEDKAKRQTWGNEMVTLTY